MASNMSDDIGDPEIEKKTGNHGIERGRFVRFKQLADERGIPVVDMRDYLDRKKIDPQSVKWAHDGHWNPTGHRLAADTLLEAFKAHPEWLKPLNADSP